MIGTQWLMIFIMFVSGLCIAVLNVGKKKLSTDLAKNIITKADIFSALFRKQYRKNILIKRDSEDFRQFCVEQMLLRETQFVRYEWLVADFFRSGQQSSRGKTNKKGKSKSVSEVENNKEREGSSREYYQVLLEIDLRPEQMLKLICDGKLVGDERIIAILLVKWGLKPVEIAECFGVSESAIGHRISDIKRQFI